MKKDKTVGRKEHHISRGIRGKKTIAIVALKINSFFFFYKEIESKQNQKIIIQKKILRLMYNQRSIIVLHDSVKQIQKQTKKETGKQPFLHPTPHWPCQYHALF